jgi:hypothetical protein
VQVGDRGEHVRRLQLALEREGFDLPRYGADGDFGEETKRALFNFAVAREIVWWTAEIVPEALLDALGCGEIPDELTGEEAVSARPLTIDELDGLRVRLEREAERKRARHTMTLDQLAALAKAGQGPSEDEREPTPSTGGQPHLLARIDAMTDEQLAEEARAVMAEAPERSSDCQGCIMVMADEVRVTKRSRQGEAGDK